MNKGSHVKQIPKPGIQINIQGESIEKKVAHKNSDKALFILYLNNSNCV